MGANKNKIKRLYLLTSGISRDYDTFDAAVVVAFDEDSARRVSPAKGYLFPRGMTESAIAAAWPGPEAVNVKYLGVAAPGLAEVVCVSFNAG